MNIGRTICIKCGKRADLSLDQFIEGLKSCQNVEEVKNIINQARLGREVELMIVCETCEGA